MADEVGESRDLEARIAALTDAQMQRTLVALAAALHVRARDKYAGDQERLGALEGAATAATPGGQLLPLDPGEVDTVEARPLLLALARQEEFRDDVHQALQQQQFVAFTGLEPMIVATVITFVLSLRFNFNVKREGGETKLAFSIGKGATGAGLIGRILGLGSAAGQGDGEAGG